MSVRIAKATWKGTLREGSGVMNFSNYEGPFSYLSRFEEGEGTNPEELAGAAHAGCYSMFLSALISAEKLSPESIETIAGVHLGRDENGPVITMIELDCRVKCDGLAPDKFNDLAAAAKAKCPISRLFAGTEIVLKASLV